MSQQVYVMQDRSSGLIKVGISQNPDAPAGDVAREFGAEVVLLSLLEVDDARAAEKFLHGALEKHRVMGEWFQVDERRLGYLLAFFKKSLQSASNPSKRRLNAIRYSERSNPTHSSEPAGLEPLLPTLARKLRRELKRPSRVQPIRQSAPRGVGLVDAAPILEQWRTLDALAHDDLSPITTEAQNERALELLEVLWQEVPEGEVHHPLASLFDLLVSRIAAFEAVAYPIPESTPERRLAFLMRQHELTQTRLSELGGMDQGNISKILKGERSLTVEQIRTLAGIFHVSPAVFL